MKIMILLLLSCSVRASFYEGGPEMAPFCGLDRNPVRIITPGSLSDDAEEADITSYEGGPEMAPFCGLDRNPVRIITPGSLSDDAEEADITRYMRDAALIGAGRLKRLLQKMQVLQTDFSGQNPVAINFMVPGGCCAVQSYKDIFSLYIGADLVKLGFVQVSAIPNDLDVNTSFDTRGMVDGLTVVVVYDFIEEGLEQYLCLNVLKDKGFHQKRIIFQFLINAIPKKKEMRWKGKTITIPGGERSAKLRLHAINRKLYNDYALMRLIDSLVCDAAVAPLP
ncbi:MAG: hypothetical protein OXC30_06455 [Alphaproteobacteria bacterium]|nr:hypothetical protein [Alphaproteobacteria bacterium]